MRRGPCGGFTLIEIMTVTTLLAVFSGAALMLSATLFSSDRRCEGYTADILGSRRAVIAISRDLRQAARVVVNGEDVRVVQRGGEDDVIYRLESNTLTRQQGERSTVVTHGIANFAVQPNGSLAHLRLTLRPRNPQARHTATLATTVRLRCPEPQETTNR
ncbi:MAG: prepilin-type N-terminal cleavage/methylation domain-containing protein [Planctomycetota bacterium]